MEFSFRVSEAEFVRAARLERTKSTRASLKTAMFWVVVMLCLGSIYGIVKGGHPVSGSSQSRAVPQPNPISANPVGALPALLQRAGPILVLAGLWILIVAVLVPLRLRYLHRRDPRMQAEFTVSITPESITTENAAGTFSTSGWNVYDYWIEGKGLVVLMFRSGAYAVLSTAALSGAEQAELRGILSAALPEK